jgi:hypothetical protein
MTLGVWKGRYWRERVITRNGSVLVVKANKENID